MSLTGLGVEAGEDAVVALDEVEMVPIEQRGGDIGSVAVQFPGDRLRAGDVSLSSADANACSTFPLNPLVT